MKKKREDYVSNQLEYYMIKKGMSMEDIAAYSGVSRTAIYNWRMGRCAPSAPVAVKVAKALGCTVEDIWS